MEAFAARSVTLPASAPVLRTGLITHVQLIPPRCSSPPVHDAAADMEAPVGPRLRIGPHTHLQRVKAVEASAYSDPTTLTIGRQILSHGRGSEACIDASVRVRKPAASAMHARGREENIYTMLFDAGLTGHLQMCAPLTLQKGHRHKGLCLLDSHFRWLELLI